MPALRTGRNQPQAALQCKICHKKYSKAEHLQRHERTHTGIKPFACTICGRRFSRGDSLARHDRTHASQPAPTPLSQTTWPHSQSMLDMPALEPLPSSTIHYTNDIGTGSAPIDYEFPYEDITNLNMALEWPDSEDLLQTIVNTNWDLLALPPASSMTASGPPAEPLVDSQQDENHQERARPSETVSRLECHELSPPSSSREAIQSLSNMLTKLSRGVTSAVEELPELTSTFLDNCLQAYFAHFNTRFQILHRPTFVFRDCSPSLVLNAIALGSLYMGTTDAIIKVRNVSRELTSDAKAWKGEALWKLAHTAVATSWQALMRHRGPFDSHEGVQLLLTALLGQCYAMMSKNQSLRLTSQVFHNLGFQWASQCNMFSISTSAYSGRAGGDSERCRAWRTWASKEVHRRALVGHYILDGRLAYLSGRATNVIHAINKLGFAVGGSAFEAPSQEDWHNSMMTETGVENSFSEVYKQLFASNASTLCGDSCIGGVRTSLDARVILECLRGLIRDSQDPNSGFADSIFTVPSLDQTKMALMRVYDLLSEVWKFDHFERLELMLDWHILNIEGLCNTTHLTDEICRHFEIDQSIFQSCSQESDLQTSIRWAQDSVEAKCVFLHAAAALDILGQLSLNQTHSFWMSIPVFAVSVVLSLFRLSGISSVSAPLTIHWRSTISTGDDVHLHSNSTAEKTKAFLKSDITTPSSTLGPSRNLLFELRRLQASLHGLAIQWGLAMEMHHVLEQIAAVNCIVP